MQRSIATVSLSGTLPEKLEAIAAASGATIVVVVIAVIILDLCIGLDLLSERK